MDELSPKEKSERWATYKQHSHDLKDAATRRRSVAFWRRFKSRHRKVADEEQRLIGSPARVSMRRRGIYAWHDILFPKLES